MGTFGQVIPVIGTPLGFLGEVTRTGGGDPFIMSRESNPANAQNIKFGDPVVILPDATGGTCKGFADWQANGGGLGVAGNTASSTTFTPTSAALAGISNGMLVFGSGIPAGTYVVSVNPIAGTVTLSKAATANAAVTLYFVKFAGFACREVKTQLGYPYAPYGSALVGYYAPGDYVDILTRGGIIVTVPVGTPVAEGPAYMRAILNGSIPAGLLGSVEANADGVNNLLLSSVPGVAAAYFKNGVLGANNLCELTLINRTAA